MVCALKKNQKDNLKKISKRKMKPIEQEMTALRSLVPGSKNLKSDLDLVLEAIQYIQQLEDKLRSVSSPALLKAQFIAVHRMRQQQCEL